MRGGSIPVFAWGTLLLILLAINWIWSGRAIQVASFGFAVLAVWSFAVAFFLLHRDSIRRGPPERRSAPLAVPALSLGAVALGVSVATILFGFVWAHFLVYFGAGLMALSLGRLVIEVRWQRRSLAAARQGEITRVEHEDGGIVTPGGRLPDGAISETDRSSHRIQTRDRV